MHDIRSYTAEAAFRQVSLHMIQNLNKFYPQIEQELIETGESYESYVYNVYQGNVWGDDLIASVLGDMWNIAISLVAPCYNNPVPLFHNKEVPDVILIVNGGCWRSMKKAALHFSATSAKDKSFKIPGSALKDTHREAESLAKVLAPTLLTNREDTRKREINDYKHQEAMRSLKLLRSVAVCIDKLNEKIADMIEELEEVIEMKKMLEYNLTCLGVSAEKIAEAGELQERGFIRTEDREKIHREGVEKRK